MTTEAKLQVQELRGGYNTVEVLHGIDLMLKAGEIVAIFGPNGAGKTTTLLTIMGVLPPFGGTIAWDGDDKRVSASRRARSGVALVRERSLFLQLSVADNLRLGQGEPDHALEYFPELKPILKRRAGLLSGGEQQMVTIGRALAAKPSVLLLDEVSAGLAPIIVDRLFEAIRQAAGQGVSVMMVEQQLRRALALAHRGYVLNEGRVSFEGTKEDFYQQLTSVEESYFTAGSSSEAANN